MDNYPEHLAPEFEKSGAVSTPFAEWWPRVQAHFQNVPENVARYWLHEHWNHSPYSYLRSANYQFIRKNWPNLKNIRSSWGDFKPENEGTLEKGKELVTSRQFGHLYSTAEYMLEYQQFPVPIIILDNRDGHHNVDYPEEFPLPAAYILIEGHTRFNIGLYLHVTGRLDSGDVWLMTKTSA
jgi:hypothetical protein